MSAVEAVMEVLECAPIKGDDRPTGVALVCRHHGDEGLWTSEGCPLVLRVANAVAADAEEARNEAGAAGYQAAREHWKQKADAAEAEVDRLRARIEALADSWTEGIRVDASMGTPKADVEPLERMVRHLRAALAGI